MKMYSWFRLSPLVDHLTTDNKPFSIPLTRVTIRLIGVLRLRFCWLSRPQLMLDYERIVIIIGSCEGHESASLQFEGDPSLPLLFIQTIQLLSLERWIRIGRHPLSGFGRLNFFRYASAFLD